MRVRATWAQCLALVSVWLGSGCAFPVLSGEPQDARSFAYREPTRDARVRSGAARTHSRSSSQRSEASVLSPLPGTSEAAVGRVAEPADCFEALARLEVPFEHVDEDYARGVRLPIRLTGAVAGVTFAVANGTDSHAVLDCRLALALHRWAPDLRQRGVVRVEHYSMYRANARVGGKSRVSGHAHGMAIDAAHFILDDGTRLDVLEDWESRERGAPPCPMRPDEGFGSRLLRSVTCQAVDEKLFQVVITPHHDRAHQNHLHLELKPEVDWTYVR